MFTHIGYAQQVIFGAGALAELPQAVDRFGWRRLLLCAGQSMRANGRAAQVEALLGGRLAAVYDSVRPHVQDGQLAEVVALAEERQVDALIGLGGGSPIGMAKAAAFALEERRTGRPAASTAPLAEPLVPVIAVPATYAGSEMTAVCGVTYTGPPPRKVTMHDPKLAPRLVVYDPELTLDLPPALTAASGMNALAHCIEALYSIARNPLSSAAAAAGVERITRSLPRCWERGGDLDARTEMLLGAHLAGASLAGVKMGLHHGVCHVLGGSAGVPHGVANAIMLPHVLRFNAPAVAELLLPAAAAMGLPDPARDPAAAVAEMARRIAALAEQMDLPRRLRDAGVSEDDLPRLARLAVENPTVQNNPRQIESAAQLEALLREAW